MDNQKVGGTHLKVSIAKKQLVNPSNEAVPNEDWCYIGTITTSKILFDYKYDWTIET